MSKYWDKALKQYIEKRSDQDEAVADLFREWFGEDVPIVEARDTNSSKTVTFTFERKDIVDWLATDDQAWPVTKGKTLEFTAHKDSLAYGDAGCWNIKYQHRYGVSVSVTEKSPLALFKACMDSVTRTKKDSRSKIVTSAIIVGVALVVFTGILILFLTKGVVEALAILFFIFVVCMGIVMLSAS